MMQEWVCPSPWSSVADQVLGFIVSPIDKFNGSLSETISYLNGGLSYIKVTGLKVLGAMLPQGIKRFSAID